jgi:hypothetical protein
MGADPLPLRSLPGAWEEARIAVWRQHPVFPVENRGKAPLGRLAPRGFKDATLDMRRVESWSLDAPDANYGIVLEDGRLTVVEVDPYHGGSLRVLCEQLGDEAVVCVSVSGRGAHVLMRSINAPNGHVLGPGMTVKSDGSYIVGPGSLHPNGRRYGRSRRGWERFLGEDLPDVIVPGEVPERPQATPEQGTRADLEPILAKLAERGVTAKESKPANGPGTILPLSDCPFYPNEDHTTAAALYAWEDGNVGFRCLGGRCTEADHRIRDLLELLGMDGGRKNETTEVLMTRTADQIADTEQRWLQEGRIPLGELTILTGRGDVGKTAVVADYVARATTGDLTGTPVRVLYITEGEVGAEHAKRLLRAAGANLSMVVFDDDPARSLLTIPDDVPKLENTIRAGGFGLVAFDNLEAHVNPGGGDIYSENTIRSKVTGPLIGAARRTESAILGIKHPPKGGAVHAHDLVGGSVAWVNASRSAFLLRDDPDEPDRKLLIHMKKNQTQYHWPTQEFELRPSLWKPSVPVVRWGGDRPEVTASSFDAKTFRDDLAILIKNALRDGPKTPADVAALAPDYTPATVRQRMHRMSRKRELIRLEGGRYAPPRGSL